MTATVPHSTDTNPDPTTPVPAGYVASLSELMGELSRLMLRAALPDARIVFWPEDRPLTASLEIHTSDTTAVDAWAAALGLGEPEATLHEYDDQAPIWTYRVQGRWLGAFASVGTSHDVPTGDELIEQPAAAA